MYKKEKHMLLLLLLLLLLLFLLLKVARKMSFGESLLSYYIFYMS